MRTLYLCNDHGIDLAGKNGAAIHLRSFARALVDLGHEVIVACSLPGCKQTLEKELHSTIWPAPLSPWNPTLAQARRATNRMIGRTPRSNPDAVRAPHNLTLFLAAMCAAVRTRIRKFHTPRIRRFRRVRQAGCFAILPGNVEFEK